MKQIYLSVFVAIALSMFVGCSGDSADEPEEEALPLCEADHLENTVEAASWAQQHTDIAAYNYIGDVAGGSAEIALLDDDDAPLGEMTVRQLFGDDEEPDGVMEAVFDDGSSPLRLVTRGEHIDNDGYTVRMHLQREDKEPTVHLSAEFRTVPCWLENDPAVAPECAAELPLDSPAFALPSCGLIVDDRIREQRPPQLERLTYSVAAHQAEGAPTHGATQRDGPDHFHRIDVYDSDGAADEDVVTQWLAETGADAVVGSEQERLSTTAFLDRSWWRKLEYHIAHCDFEELSDREDDSEAEEDTDSQTQSLCAGNQNNDDWGEDDDSSDSKVWGDPHLVTLDGHSYDLQAAGEFVLLEAHDGDPLVVQGRFEALEESEIEGCGDLTWNTAAATEIDGRRLTVRVHPHWEVRIDGELVEGPDDIPELSVGASVIVDSSEVRVRWPGGERVAFTLRDNAELSSLTVHVDLPSHRLGQVRGLLGQFDGDPNTDVVLPDGTVLEQPASFEDLYDVLAPAWRVDRFNTLFDYREGEDADSFYVEDFPTTPVNIDSLPDELVSDADETCRNEDIADAHVLHACILDVVCFEDDDFAEAADDTESPIGSQPPGRHDLAVSGDIRNVRLPGEVAAVPEPQPEACEVLPDPKISLFVEGEETTLEQELDVDIAEPGFYDGSESLSPATIDADTQLASYHLHRGIPTDPQRRYAGRIDFEYPIAGVLVEGDAVADTDDELGAGSTGYDSEGFEGLRTEEDHIAISEDRRTLEVEWKDAEAHRIRILTETP